MRPVEGFALDADRVEVAGDVLLDSEFSAQGEARLSNRATGRCYGPELPGAAGGVPGVSASRACSRARISSGV
jgi:hypothetical protein